MYPLLHVLQYDFYKFILNSEEFNSCMSYSFASSLTRQSNSYVKDK
jgi:hypothetical protein